MDGSTHRLTGDRFAHTRQFEDHATRFDIGDPPFRRALARAHPGFGRFLGQRPVREDIDPHFAPAFDVAGHGVTCGLDLPVCDVGARYRLDTVVTETQRRAAGSHTAPLGVVLLAELDPAWN